MTSLRKSAGALATFVVLACAALAAAADVEDGRVADPTTTFKRPADLVPVADPGKDRVWTIGQTLFADARLSASRTMSCASCHDPATSWTDHRIKAMGDDHRELKFRVPTLINAGQIARYGWTGKFRNVEDVTFFAMSSPLNMNLSLQGLLDRLGADPGYREAFAAAFPDHQISKANVGTALSRFVRSIASAPAPFDRWVAGDSSAISPQAARGFEIFRGRGRCADCHTGWAMTDGSFHDVGTASGADLGRGSIFKTSVKLQYAFKTPTLRNVAVRAPYMHNGSFATLGAVVDHYDHGGIDRPSRAEGIMPLHLDDADKAALVAFLETLTSPTEFVKSND